MTAFESSWHRRRHHPDDAFEPHDERPGRGHRHGGPGRGFGGGPGGPGFGAPGGGPRGRRGRAPRGDVRSAILLLLAQEPMHGYQLMQAIADRSGGRWTPSPGAIYPALAQLEDEGLVTVAAASGRKVATLTDEGRALVAEQTDLDPFAGFGTAGPDLRTLMVQLHDAARQVDRTGATAQREAAATVLTDARRALYLLLADGPEA